MNLRRWLPALTVTLVAAAFTWLNRGEAAVVDLGVARFYRAPLTLVVFVAFVAGMLSMLLLSLRHDRRLRAELRARGLLDPAPSGPVLVFGDTAAGSDAPAEDDAVPLRLELQPDDGPAAADDVPHLHPSHGDEVTRIHPAAGDDVTRIHPAAGDDVTRIHPADDPDVMRIRPGDGDGGMTRDAGRVHPHDDRAP